MTDRDDIRCLDLPLRYEYTLRKAGLGTIAALRAHIARDPEIGLLDIRNISCKADDLVRERLERCS